MQLFSKYFCLCCALPLIAFSNVSGETCMPTEPDMLGPFYKAGAPVRSHVGKGYILTGTVRSAKDCSLIKGAKIEFWLAGPNGTYDDQHRATAYADNSAAYRFESNPPTSYYGRPAHIHLRVTASAFKPLVTQHYSATGASTGTFDIVLIPAE